MKFPLKKLLFGLLATIILSKSNYSSTTKHEHIWNTEDEMSKYFLAIQDFHDELSVCINKQRNQKRFIKDGFEFLNPMKLPWNRTPNFMFLEIHTSLKQNRIIRLYTPFGEIYPLISGNPHATNECANDFLALINTKWLLNDVTDNIEFYNFGSRIKFIESYRKNILKDERIIGKLYLIRKINHHIFIKDDEDITSNNFAIYQQLKLCPNQMEIDRIIFSNLSNKKNSF